MITIQELGNQLVININGGKLIAYPTMGGLWVVKTPEEVQPPPADPPVDGDTFSWPFPLTTVTSEYRSADRPTHNGMDFAYAGIGGVAIGAAGAGVCVTSVVNFGDTSWGNYVVIDHTNGSNGLRTLYAHMQAEPEVQVGDTVSKGQRLGVVGNTGNSFGDHLHFETFVDGSYVNPRDFMATYA